MKGIVDCLPAHDFLGIWVAAFLRRFTWATRSFDHSMYGVLEGSFSLIPKEGTLHKNAAQARHSMRKWLPR